MRAKGDFYALRIADIGARVTNCARRLHLGPSMRPSSQELRSAFDRQHHRAYGHVFGGREVEIVNIRVVGAGIVPELQPQRIGEGGATPPAGAITACCDAIFDVNGAPTPVCTPRFARAQLRAGNRIAGPAIIDQMDTTTVIPPGFTGRVDYFGNLVIAVR